jgi:hypothetical protein
MKLTGLIGIGVIGHHKDARHLRLPASAAQSRTIGPVAASEPVRSFSIRWVARPAWSYPCLSGKLAGMDDETRRRLLRAVIGEHHPGRGRVRRWTALEVAERAGLVLNHARRGLQELRDQDPPLVWGDANAGPGEELWWLLPDGLNELDRLEAGERR